MGSYMTRLDPPPHRNKTHVHTGRGVIHRRSRPKGGACEQEGRCEASPQIWGQYSPFYSVPSDIDASLPPGCELTFALVLSRHGARDPTARKSVLYASLIDRIHASVSEYGAGYEWLRDYNYTLGEDQLTAFGVQQMVDSGAAFYSRYRSLVDESEPFVRAAGSQRVIESSEHFVRGFYSAQDRGAESQVEDILVIPEQPMENNTLNNRLCLSYSSNLDMVIEKKQTWNKVWVPNIRQRLNDKLPGANLSLDEVIVLMDLCPFESVAHEDLRISKFCALFSEGEWLGYDYFQSVGKWYGYGPGNPLGPTLGVGFVNELISRMTGSPVQDETSTNSTLNTAPATFPLDRKLYADFSHDNDMTSIYGAMGLYNSTGSLPVTHRVAPRDAEGYSVAWTVPFAGRMYVEKMRCKAADDWGRDNGEETGEEELVRVLMNDRVLSLPNCEADILGRCKLKNFVKSLDFARSGGRWDECFA